MRRVTVVLVVALAPLLGGCGAADDETDDHFAEIIRLAIGTDEQSGDIDDFWREEFARLGVQYRSPSGFYPYDPDDPPDLECDIENWARNAFYCRRDETISWDEEWLRDGVFVFSETVDMVPLTILAHEWGHHVQNMLGVAPVSVQRELQADCFAALYIDYADRGAGKIALEPGDVGEAMAGLFAVGDNEFHEGNWFEPGIHGDGPARRLAFARGYITADIDYCRAYDEYELADPVTIGGYSLSLAPGMRYEREITSGGPRGIELTGQGLTMQVASGETVAGTAADELPAVAEAWFGASETTPVGGVEVFDAVPAGVSAANQRYEQRYTTQDGTVVTVHGALFLLVNASGETILFDVFRDGPAPADNAQWEEIGDLLFSSVFGLADFGLERSVR